MPGSPDPAVCRDLIGTWDRSVYEALLGFKYAPVVIPKYKGKKGHPLLLSKELVEPICQFDENATLRDVLAMYPTLAVPVDCPHILVDIDDSQDYRTIKGASS